MNEVCGASPAVKDLAEGFSTQSKIANRMWLTVSIVSFFILLPDSSIDDHGNRILPFNLGSTDVSTFNVLIFFILSIVTIAFCSARSQALIAYSFAHREIDQIEDEKDRKQQRQFFDILTSPTLVRIGPIAVIMRQQTENVPILRKAVDKSYVILKHLALIVFFGVPFLSVLYGWLAIYRDTSVLDITKIICALMGISVLALVLQNWLADALSTRLIQKRFASTSKSK